MPVRRECTVMFYLASDNPLAISVVSQLKAIKAAGYHPEANVIVQFDPSTEGLPTHIFDVNLINKTKNKGVAKIGFDGDDSFVRNMIEDKLWGEEKDRNNNPIREVIAKFVPGYDPPKNLPKPKLTPADEVTNEVIVATANAGTNAGANVGTVAAVNTAHNGGANSLGLAAVSAANNGDANPEINTTRNGHHKEVSPREGLRSFLEFCQREYPANHYLLFILGHGVVVGNDVFLFDENAVEHSLTLGGLREELEVFKSLIDKHEGKFELVGFHSCSVSSLEVAYELKGTANYMLASQGTAFVGSWPYRQILVRIFKDLEALNEQKRGRSNSELDIRNLLITIFRYCLHNSTDFLLAGYPFDLCLCDLNQMSRLERPLETLCQSLKDGLEDTVGRNLILLAHWKAQSFYKEMYTDLADFCFCLKTGIEELPEEIMQLPGTTSELLQNMVEASTEVFTLLSSARLSESGSRDHSANGGRTDNVIICSEFAGPEYQYARGLSVYFPWAAPSEDRAILDEYGKYKLSSLKPSWLEFLNDYFTATKRKTRRLEPDKPDDITAEQALLEDQFSLVYGQAGPAGSENALDQGSGKTDPKDATGGDCGCPSIKNYPRDTRGKRQRLRLPTKEFSVGHAFLPTAE